MVPTKFGIFEANPLTKEVTLEQGNSGAENSSLLILGCINNRIARQGV